MYSIVEIAGHQYKVKAGDIVDVDKLNAEVGSDIDFDQVLFVSGDTPAVGNPTVSGAKIKARVIRQEKSRKLLIFKNKRRSGHRTKNGHRTHYTGLLITEVTGNGNTETIDKDSKEAKKYLA